MSRVRIEGARGRRNVRPCRMRAAANSSVFRCALKVLMVAELLVTGGREFQTAGAVNRDTECFGLEVDPCRRLME